MELSNKLFLMFSIFFLFVSIFEIVISAPPFLAGVSAISLQTEYLEPSQNISYVTFALYGVHVMNAVLGGIIAAVGMISRKKFDLDITSI